MIKILKLALPWILIIGSILVLQSERLPSYFSRLFSGLFFLYLFLYNLRKIYKNPKKKLEWVEYLELILSPLASLFAFYAFCQTLARGFLFLCHRGISLVAASALPCGRVGIGHCPVPFFYFYFSCHRGFTLCTSTTF